MSVQHPTLTVGGRTYRPTLWEHNRRRRLTVMDAVAVCIIDAHMTISCADLGASMGTAKESTLRRVKRLRLMGLVQLVPLGRHTHYGLTMKGRRTIMEEER
jgi:hypothetical protein